MKRAAKHQPASSRPSQRRARTDLPALPKPRFGGDAVALGLALAVHATLIGTASLLPDDNPLMSAAPPEMMELEFELAEVTSATAPSETASETATPVLAQSEETVAEEDENELIPWPEAPWDKEPELDAEPEPEPESAPPQALAVRPVQPKVEQPKVEQPNVEPPPEPEPEPEPEVEPPANEFALGPVAPIAPEPSPAPSPEPSPEPWSPEPLGPAPAAAPVAVAPVAPEPGPPASTGEPVEGFPDAGDAYGAPPGGGPFMAAGMPGADPLWSMGNLMPDIPFGGKGAAPTKPRKKRETDSDIAGKVLAGTIAQRDRDLGLELPSAGVVANAVEVAVRGAPVEDDTRATIAVQLSPDGQVIGSKVISANKGNALMWERMARQTAAALASQELRMRGEAAKRGATIIVDVEAHHLYAAGSKEKVNAKPVCANQVIHDLANALGDQGPPQGALQPGDPTADTPDFCIPIGIAGVTDLSNIGSTKQTVVRTKHRVVVDGIVALPSSTPDVNTDAPWMKRYREKEGPEPVLPPKWRRKKKEWEERRKQRSGDFRMRPPETTPDALGAGRGRP